MDVRSIIDGELGTLAALAVPLQARPESHVAYLGAEPDGIESELAETTWQDVSAVALVDGDAVGWLVGDIDRDLGRVWWFGPFVAGGHWESVASALLGHCRKRLPDGVTQEEFAVDARFDRCRAWSSAFGFVGEEASAVLRLDSSTGRALGPPIRPVRPLVASDHDHVAQLHDRLFPGTHTTGAGLVTGEDATHRRLVLHVDGSVAGYVAVELQADDGGYIDFLGVDPTARRQGLGRDLVVAGVAELYRLGATEIGLTVRAGNTGARALYASLGFEEERMIVPLRRGFSLA
jgi:ribosomal protein S18 acetylase RimI-like enzyme